MQIKVMLVDDHEVVRAGVRAILSRAPDIEIVGEAVNGKAALAAARELHPDVILMDVAMPIMDGAEATARLRVELPDIKIVVLTMRSDKACIDNMAMAGASGFVPKNCEGDELLRAIHSVMEGNAYLSPSMARVFMSEYVGMASQVRKLTHQEPTPGELDVLGLMVRGKSVKEIAAQLSINRKTVEDRRQKLMAKLNVTSTAELIAYAVRHGLTTLEP